MARGMPSMVALLGLLAVAGYQNKDKIAELLRGSGRTGSGSSGGATGQSGLDHVLSNLGGLLGGGGAGTVVSGGLGELLDRFKQKGQGETADSWVKTGPNQPISPDQLEQTLGPETLTTLEQQTGLSRARNSSPGSRERCLKQSTDTRQRAGFPKRMRLPGPPEVTPCATQPAWAGGRNRSRPCRPAPRAARQCGPSSGEDC